MTTMRCAQFDDRLHAYLEGEMPAQERMAAEAHAASCARCGPLLAEVRAIVREASALPELTPSRDLWDGISARIEAPVVELEHRKARLGAPGGPSWRVAAAAAAVLVAITALATWQLTLSSDDRAARVERIATTDVPGPVDTTRDSVRTVATPTNRVPETSAPTPAPSVRQSTSAPSTAVRNAAAALPTSVYDREIASLRRMLDTRRGELDTATVRVLEENLQLIDRAIEQSRQALARDPNSTFLVDHLNDALGRKVELLRTAALLQSSS